jgi:hypothetical protein
MAVDANGILKIYPTRVGGAEFISDSNLDSNAQFNPGNSSLVSDGGGVWHLADYSVARMRASPKANYQYDAIGGCNNNFADNLRRGYATTPDDWNNIEMTEYVKFSSASPSDAEIILKGPSGHHTSSNCCQGSSYGCRTGTENPTNTEFFKEEWHVSYDSRGFINLPSMGNFKDNNWHGIKFMNYEVIVNGKKCRKLEHWLDKDADQNWVKVNETIDQGGWNQHGDVCHGAKDQILTWAMGWAYWRFDLNSTDMKFKWLSCREIDINGNPDQGGGSGGEGGGSGTGGGSPSIGPDGVAKIYPDMQGKFIWYMNNSKPLDGHLEVGGGSTYSNLVKNGDGSWKPNKDGTVKFNILVTPGQKDATGGCKMDFKACVARGYTGKPDDIGKPGVEMTAFYKMTSAVDHQGIYMRGPFNHHPSGSGLCCQEAEYDVEVTADGKFKFTKELQGEVTHPQGIQTISPSFTPLGAGWFGLKYIFIIESDEPTNPKIRLECWLNRNGDKVTWQKIGSATDFVGNKWGINSAVCNGDPYQVYAWAARGMVIKWYNGHIDFRDWSVRTIDPTGTFENPPPITCPSGQHLENGVCVPDTGTGGGGTGGGNPTHVKGFLRLFWDINTVSGGGACQGTGGGGGGGSGTLGKIYEVAAVDANTKALSNSPAQNHRTRIVQTFNSSTAPQIGQIPKQVDVPLLKVGSPSGTAKVLAKIYSSTGGTLYVSPTAIDPATLTTSFTIQTFDFTTNTHTLQQGDNIGVTYGGTSDTDYVRGSYDNDIVAGSIMSNYENGKYDNHPERDMAMTIWA